VIVAAERRDEHAVLAAIGETGLELQTIFNRGAVMVLSAGVNKATGLAAALEALGLTPHEAAAIGDAENDHAFLDLSEFSAAVANALPALKERADWVTTGDDGHGVCELIEELVGDDLVRREVGGTRHDLVLGTHADGRPLHLSPRGPNLLITGPSGSGKSTAAMSLLERLTDGHYQFCIIDPRGTTRDWSRRSRWDGAAAARWSRRSSKSSPSRDRAWWPTCWACPWANARRFSSSSCRGWWTCGRGRGGRTG